MLTLRKSRSEFTLHLCRLWSFYLGDPHHSGILRQRLTVQSVLPWLGLMAYALSFVWLYFLKIKHSNKLRALHIITVPSFCYSASQKNDALTGPWPPAPSPGATGYESVAGLPGILWDTTCEPQLGTLISQRPESKHCNTFPGNAGAAFKTVDNLEVPVFLGGWENCGLGHGHGRVWLQSQNSRD